MKRYFNTICAVVITSLLPSVAFAQTGTIAPSPKFVGLDGNGNPVVSGKLCTFSAGTSTPATTYQDSGLAASNANPTILDSSGRATVFLATGASYKFVLRAADGADATCNTGSILWTVDGIGSVPSNSGNLDVLGTAGEALSAGEVVYLSDGSGGGVAGTWRKADADFTYASSNAVTGIVPNAILSAAVGTIRLGGQATGLSGLVVGSTYYVSATAGAMSTSPGANIRVVGVADAVTSLVMIPPSVAASLTIAVEQTTTATGTQNDFAISSAPILELRANNATAITITGFGTPVGGRMIDIISIGAGQVNLADQSGSSVAANRIITGLGATLELAAGFGRARLIYDATTARWRVLEYASGSANLLREGLQFPATQVVSSGANTLDDYEEGSWTPVIGGSGGTSGQTYSVQVGRYIKTGRVVTVTFNCIFTAKGTITTNVEIQGLPFTVSNVPNAGSVGAVTWTALATNWVSVVARAVPNGTVASITGAAAAAVANTTALTTADIGNTTAIEGTLTYFADN